VPPNALTEQALVQAFVVPKRRSRYINILASQRGREKLRSALGHFADLDPRFATRINESSVEGVARLLYKNGAPQRCYVLSESDAIDAEELHLDEALRKVVGQGMGTLLSCTPGKLAYYEGEEPGERYILMRP
jgi:hypothetical protein